MAKITVQLHERDTSGNLNSELVQRELGHELGYANMTYNNNAGTKVYWPTATSVLAASKGILLDSNARIVAVDYTGSGNLVRATGATITTATISGELTCNDDIVLLTNKTIGDINTGGLSFNSNVGQFSSDVILTAGSLYFRTDGKVIYFGANDDVTLTHVHDVGLKINRDLQLTEDKTIGITDGGGLSFTTGNRVILTTDKLFLREDAFQVNFGLSDEVTLTHVHNVGLKLNEDLQLNADKTIGVTDGGGLSFDASNNASFSAIMTANSGTFTNGLKSSTGSFSSDIKFANGTFGTGVGGAGTYAGGVNANTGTFDAGLKSTVGTFAGKVGAANIGLPLGTDVGTVSSTGTYYLSNAFHFDAAATAESGKDTINFNWNASTGPLPEGVIFSACNLGNASLYLKANATSCGILNPKNSEILQYRDGSFISLSNWNQNYDRSFGTLGCTMLSSAYGTFGTIKADFANGIISSTGSFSGEFYGANGTFENLFIHDTLGGTAAGFVGHVSVQTFQCYGQLTSDTATFQNGIRCNKGGTFSESLRTSGSFIASSTVKAGNFIFPAPFQNEGSPTAAGTYYLEGVFQKMFNSTGTLVNALLHWNASTNNPPTGVLFSVYNFGDQTLNVQTGTESSPFTVAAGVRTLRIWDGDLSAQVI